MDNNNFNYPMVPLKKRPSAFKTLLKSLVFPIIYLAAQYMVSVVFSVIAGMRAVADNLLTSEEAILAATEEALSSTMEMLPAISVAYCVITIAAAIVTVGTESGWGRTLLREMRLGDSGPLNLLLALVLGVALNFATTYAIELIPFPQSMVDQYNEQVGGMIYSTSPLMMFSIGLLVPIAEELAFRIMPIRTLRNVFTGGVAAVTTGVVFALAHMVPLQVLYVLPTGILLGLVFVWCGGGASIAAHVGFNSLSVVALALAGDMTELAEPMTYTTAELLVPCIAGLVVSALIMVVLYKRCKPKSAEIEVISE